MIFSSELTSITGFVNQPFIDVSRSQDLHFMLYATIFLTSIMVATLFGFLRRWRKKPQKAEEPSMLVFVQENPVERMSDNSVVISDLGSSSAETRAKAARVLGERRAREALHSLVRLLQDNDRDVRFWAVWAIGSIKEQSAVFALMDCLMDQDEGVRYRAAEALGEIASAKAVDALRPCLSDRSEKVRKIAQWALQQIEGSTPPDLPEKEKAGEERYAQVPPAEEGISSPPGPPEMERSIGVETGPLEKVSRESAAMVEPKTDEDLGKSVRRAEKERTVARERTTFIPGNVEEILKATKGRSAADRDANSRSISYLRHVIKQERTEEILLSETVEQSEATPGHETDITIKVKPFDAEGQFSAGVAFSQVGDWDTAIDCYKRALRFKSDMAKAYCNLGVAYCHQSKYREGIFYLRQAIRFRPNWPKPYINLGIAYSQNGDWEGSIKALQKGTRNPAEKLHAYYNLGIAYSQVGQWEKSAQAFTLVVNSNPEDVQAMCNLGIAYSYLGCWGEATEAFRQSTLINPTDPRLQCCLGLLYCHLGRYDEGIKAFEAAIRIKPDDVEAYCILGLAKGQLGLWDGAAVALNQAVRIRDDFPEIQYYLGVIYEEQGRWQEAANSFKQFVQLGVGEDHREQFAFEGHRIRWEEMKQALTQTLKYNPKMIEAYHLLGRYYEQTNDWQEASAAFMEAAKLKIRENQPSFILGELDERSFGQQRALEEIRRVILNKPEFFRPRYSLSVSLNDFERYRKTYLALKRMIQINPHNGDTFYKLGRTCSYLGQYGEAIQAYKEAARLAPENLMAHYYLAISYLAVGDRMSASEEYVVIKGLNEQLAGILFN